jgi:LuxR family maltose regulon positive regulatory protein
MVTALLLDAVARDALRDTQTAGRALESALDAAEPHRMLIPFLIHPAPGLLERHARQRTAHAALLADVLSLLSGSGPIRIAPPAATPIAAAGRIEPLSQAETRVLRYLPTPLTVAEIAGQLSVSENTIRTHMRHIYDKLDVHRRHEAVERARAISLLASARRRA